MVVVRDDDLLCLTHGSTEQELDKAHPPWTSAANCRPPRAARRHGPPVLASSCLVVLDRAVGVAGTVLRIPFSVDFLSLPIIEP
jgi:hypothetical protein